MNLILLYEQESVDATTFVVTGERARHIFSVLGAKPGTKLRVGLCNGPPGQGLVLDSTPAKAVIECAFEDHPPRLPEVTLILAIPRPRTLKKVLPAVTSMGVGHIVLTRTWRVAKPYLEASILQPETFRPLLHEGLMQGRLTMEPSVEVVRSFGQLVEEVLPRLKREGEVRLVPHPTADAHIASVELLTDKPVSVLIGPEGGLIAREVERLEQDGFLPVRIAAHPLRVEHACVAALAQIELLRERTVAGGN